MKYSIRENSDGSHTLMRYGTPSEVDGGRPNNAELEFWFEIERLRDELAELREKAAKWDETQRIWGTKG